MQKGGMNVREAGMLCPVKAVLSTRRYDLFALQERLLPAYLYYRLVWLRNKYRCTDAQNPDSNR